jgi:hypothetical protein
MDDELIHVYFPPPSLMISDLLDKFAIPMDWVTFIVVLVNFSVLGLVIIFYYAPMLLQQICLVIMSALMVSY